MSTYAYESAVKRLTVLGAVFSVEHAAGLYVLTFQGDRCAREAQKCLDLKGTLRGRQILFGG